VQAAWEKDPQKYKKKWKTFTDKIDADNISSSKRKKIISTLDDERQWAALHYAVECNNEELCRTLTSKNGRYTCGTLFFLLKQTAFIASKNNTVDVNILGGNGENVLHIASRSDLTWSNVSIYP
jgi:ankyrin repeat protein